MTARSRVRSLTWALLIAIGCSGGGGGSGGCGSGGGGCGGCSGCGGSCALTPIQGGFPPADRQVDSASLKISENGFNFIDTQAVKIVEQLLGTNGNLTETIPCIGPINLETLGSGILSIGATALVCDLNGDGKCDAPDNDPTNPQRMAGACQATIQIVSTKVAPSTEANGSVDVTVTVNAVVNTGPLPIAVDLNALGFSTCGFGCTADFVSTAAAPVPLIVTVNLTLDATYQNLLAFNIIGLNNLTSGIDTNDLQIGQGSASCAFGSFTCTQILDQSFVKQIILSQVSGQLTPQIQPAVDKFRCAACDSTNNNACPAGSTCDAADGGTGLCYISQSADTCPPNPLGIEGQLNGGSLLGAYGAPPEAPLNISIVAGGATKAPNPPSTYVQDMGLQVGFMGGTQAPAAPALCVPTATWTAPPPVPQMDFDAELSLPGPGTDLSSYMVGISISDDFLNKSLFDAWQSGLLCLDVTGDSISQLSASTLQLLIGNLTELTHGENVPMAVALRPGKAPVIRVGRGTSASDGGTGTADPLLNVEMDDLDLDFYALIEDRYARLFTLEGNLLVQLSLDFDPTNSTVTPSLSGICMQNVPIVNDQCVPKPVATVKNNLMNADSDTNLAGFLPGVLSIVTPLLSGVLKPIALPTVEGLQLQVLGARGSIAKPDGPGGYEHLALWADLATAPAMMMMTRHKAHTAARIVDSFIPKHPLPLDDPQTQPRVTLDLNSTSSFPGDKAYEYSYRIDNGFWSPWTQEAELAITDNALRLPQLHDIAVRSRVVGQPGTVDVNPAHVSFAVDYSPPKVSLALDPQTNEIRTLAHDEVTPDDQLSFRYAVGEADWSSPGPVRSFDLRSLGPQPSLRVEVTDSSGHTAVAQYGASVAPPALNPPASAAKHSGCAQTSAGLWGLIGVAAIWFRRRSGGRRAAGV
jgi:hypothetical protein